MSRLIVKVYELMVHGCCSCWWFFLSYVHIYTKKSTIYSQLNGRKINSLEFIKAVIVVVAIVVVVEVVKVV